MKNFTRIVFALALCSVGLYAQTVSSSLEGIVVDPADAAVASAPVTLTNTGTKQSRTANTDNTGTYRFLQVDPGTYEITVKANGFKTGIESGIVVAAQETHNGGKLVLQLGSVAESISVTAEVAEVQLESSEKSRTVDSADLADITLKGRDLFGYMKLVPGVIDTNSQARDVTSPNNLGGFVIQGNQSNTLNFTVDGVTDMDTGSNGSLHYEPNMDSIQELKVLSSNYQAEFGRNSGGTITVVTKNGTQQFHGTGQWNHRHEEFNANTWADGHTPKVINGISVATPKPDYRYNVETYSIGGPVYIPKVANKEKKHLFFFWSQEYTGQFVVGATQTTYMPTLAERGGDFSNTFANSNGSKVAVNILNPANPNASGTPQPFTGNIIPPSQITPLGQAMLNFFPLPNYSPTISTQLYVDNFFDQGSATHPRRNDVLRFDVNMTSKLSGYFRWINDHDNMDGLYSGVQFDQTNQAGRICNGGTCPAMQPIAHPNPGHGYSGTVTYTISPTLINEITVSEDWNTWSYYTLDNYADESRTLINGIPSLFPVPTTAQSGAQGPVNGYENILPQFTFGGGTLPSGAAYNRTDGTSSGTYENFNPIHAYQDNISKVKGHHAFKFGAYVELNNKIQPANKQYPGTFNFNASTSTPALDTNDGFALALLGQTSAYNQYTDTVTFNTEYWNVEWYAQDNWKINRRLTMDLGVRFYHPTPQYDLNGTFTNFVAANYTAATAPRIYYPACNGVATCSSVNNGEIAVDKATGNVVSAAYVGDVVPGSGNYIDGSHVLGTNGTSKFPYKQTFLQAAPRIGFSYDLFGNGKTALRGGFGIFYDRVQGNDVYGLTGLAPTAYNVTTSNLTFTQIGALNTGAVPTASQLYLAPDAPGQSYPFNTNIPYDGTRNASVEIQHNVDKATVIDIGYQFDYSFNQPISYNLNYLPIGTAWPFTPANLAPNTGGSNSNDIGPNYERTAFPGEGNVTGWCWCGHTNYNALNVTGSRRLSSGMSMALNYAYSKSMGLLADTAAATGQGGAPTNESWNYGRQSSDRTHNLTLTFNYAIPGVAKAMGWKDVGVVTDHWELSGIFAIHSGAPYNPTCGLVAGSPTITPSANSTNPYTGTSDLASRCQIVGNAYANVPTNGNGQVYFNPAAYAMPTINTTGPNNSVVGPPVTGDQNGGSGNLSQPRVTNLDLTLTKNIPLGSEKRLMRIQAQAYNVFNHPEYMTVGTGINFNATTNAVTNAQSVGYVTAATNSRILGFVARIEF